MRGVPRGWRTSLWEISFRFPAVALSNGMGSGSPITIGWRPRPKYIPPGRSIASNLGREMTPFDDSGDFVSSGYAYDHRRGRARVPLSFRRTSIPCEVELYRQYAERYFDANRFSEVPAETNRSGKRNSSEAWLARLVHLPSTPSPETATVGHCDITFLRSHAESRYQGSLQRKASDLDLGLAYPGADFPPPGHKRFGLMAFEPPYDLSYCMRDLKWSGDNCAEESRMRNRHRYMFLSHQQE